MNCVRVFVQVMKFLFLVLLNTRRHLTDFFSWKSGKAKIEDYERSFKRRNALFWSSINILCFLFVPKLLSLIYLDGEYLRKIVSFCFILNICAHVCSMFRKPVPVNDKKISETSLEPKKKVSSQPVEESIRSSKSLKDIKSESTWKCYKYEIGFLFNCKGLVLKSCNCPVDTFMCRLCPFRTIPVDGLKSWFLYFKLYKDFCNTCRFSYLVDEKEYQNLTNAKYPYHYCKCNCKYCTYAMNYPLKPRMNLIPDKNHCLCVCHKCVYIEDIVHGVEPIIDVTGDPQMVEMYPFRNYQLPMYHTIQSHWKSMPQVQRKVFQEDSCSARHFQFHHELWSIFKINPYDVVTWVTNLRKWISNTILKRIVKEINLVDNYLRLNGFQSMGEVGLDMLKLLAQEFADSIPTLSQIVPFLQISYDSNYVLHRVKNLSEGNMMTSFAGPCGGGEKWDHKLPSDSLLIMHMILTYFDLMCPLVGRDPVNSIFSSLYYAKTPSVPKYLDLAIYQDKESPPHYQIIINNKLNEVPSGYNNAFFTIIIFIYSVKHYHNGVLGGLNMGPRGLNMLWIVDENQNNLD